MITKRFSSLVIGFLSIGLMYSSASRADAVSDIIDAYLDLVNQQALVAGQPEATQDIWGANPPPAGLYDQYDIAGNHLNALELVHRNDLVNILNIALSAGHHDLIHWILDLEIGRLSHNLVKRDNDPTAPWIDSLRQWIELNFSSLQILGREKSLTTYVLLRMNSKTPFSEAWIWNTALNGSHGPTDPLDNPLLLEEAVLTYLSLHPAWPTSYVEGISRFSASSLNSPQRNLYLRALLNSRFQDAPLAYSKFLLLPLSASEKHQVYLEGLFDELSGVDTGIVYLIQSHFQAQQNAGLLDPDLIQPFAQLGSLIARLEAEANQTYQRPMNADHYNWLTSYANGLEDGYLGKDKLLQFLAFHTPIIGEDNGCNVYQCSDLKVQSSAAGTIWHFYGYDCGYLPRSSGLDTAPGNEAQIMYIVSQHLNDPNSENELLPKVTLSSSSWKGNSSNGGSCTNRDFNMGPQPTLISGRRIGDIPVPTDDGCFVAQQIEQDPLCGDRVITMEFSDGVEAREIRYCPFYVSSYDMASEAIFNFEDLDLPGMSGQIPAQSDSDHLPDAWESGLTVFRESPNEGFEPLDICQDYTMGTIMDGELDREISVREVQDLDNLGYRQAQHINNALGDGFQLWTEYRGVGSSMSGAPIYRPLGSSNRHEWGYRPYRFKEIRNSEYQNRLLDDRAKSVAIWPKFRRFKFYSMEPFNSSITRPSELLTENNGFQPIRINLLHAGLEYYQEVRNGFTHMISDLNFNNGAGTPSPIYQAATQIRNYDVTVDPIMSDGTLGRTGYCIEALIGIMARTNTWYDTLASGENRHINAPILIHEPGVTEHAEPYESVPTPTPLEKSAQAVMMHEYVHRTSSKLGHSQADLNLLPVFYNATDADLSSLARGNIGVFVPGTGPESTLLNDLLNVFSGGLPAPTGSERVLISIPALMELPQDPPGAGSPNAQSGIFKYDEILFADGYGSFDRFVGNSPLSGPLPHFNISSALTIYLGAQSEATHNLTFIPSAVPSGTTGPRRMVRHRLFWADVTPFTGFTLDQMMLGLVTLPAVNRQYYINAAHQNPGISSSTYSDQLMSFYEIDQMEPNFEFYQMINLNAAGCAW